MYTTAALKICFSFQNNHAIHSPTKFLTKDVTITTGLCEKYSKLFFNISKFFAVKNALPDLDQ